MQQEVGQQQAVETEDSSELVRVAPLPEDDAALLIPIPRLGADAPAVEDFDHLGAGQVGAQVPGFLVAPLPESQYRHRHLFLLAAMGTRQPQPLPWLEGQERVRRAGPAIGWREPGVTIGGDDEGAVPDHEPPHEAGSGEATAGNDNGQQPRGKEGLRVVQQL